MSLPALLPRIEQRIQSAAEKAGKIATLGPIALRTGKTEALRIIGSAVLFSDNVIDVKGQKISVVLVQAAILAAVKIPVTVKMRLGWDAENLSAPFFAREFEQLGVAAVTIHGRTREQGFTGSVDLDGIRAVVEAVERIPVIGNGDIRNIHDAIRMFEHTGCQGIAVGRGALLNPWFFLQLVRWEQTGETGEPATYEQRLVFMERHFRLLQEDRGEHVGCLLFRKVANWYCRVLRPGRELQQRMVRIASLADFVDVLERIRARRSPNDDPYPSWPEPTISVPSGPISHW